MESSDVPKRMSGVIEAPTDDALLFMNIEVGNYLMLGGTGRSIWELIDGTRSVAEIVAVLVERYDVGEDACRADVAAFVASLIEQKMVELA
ncbi:MAG: PqqD family protein [Thermohalobaculum sp.]|nr:PqqD family protein [Thermohalobaculum sp.]